MSRITLLACLSASDATLFMSAIGLRYHPETKSTVDRYTSIYRDMPELFDWMNQMLSKGHSVSLAGGGLAALYARINAPLTYWRQGKGTDTIRLWELALRQGTVVWSRTPRMRELLGTGGIMYGNVIPLPGAFPGPRRANPGGIETVCYVGQDEDRISESRTPNGVPVFEICPIAHTEKQALAPMYLGTIRARGRESETFTVPYIDVGHTLATHHTHSAMALQHLESRTRDGESGISLKKGHEFVVKLRCPDYAGDLNRDYQVVCTGPASRPRHTILQQAEFVNRVLDTGY
ncbi:hypothetical protein GGR57DRAFT_451741 [Xylariaceae sp. FL1272]|nr:hypothetical protein GGR57DRAFT_451741 [Xylariaceae sp. FL1272]